MARIYKFVLNVTTDNGVDFVSAVADTADQLIKWADETYDIPPNVWWQDCSEEWRGTVDGWHYYISQELYLEEGIYG